MKLMTLGVYAFLLVVFGTFNSGCFEHRHGEGVGVDLTVHDDRWHYDHDHDDNWRHDHPWNNGNYNR